MTGLPAFVTENAVLFFVVMCCGAALRSSTTYAIGRYGAYLVTCGERPEGWRRRAWDLAHAERTAETAAVIRRRGWVVIPLAFLTVGLQSFVMLGAGVVGMSWPRFALAAFPGWLAWGAIYSTIGFGVWTAMLAAAAGSPMGILVLVCIVALCAYMVMRRRKARHG